MLLSIELDNFKSFEGKNSLTIKDLTTIIGLNSAGKTNVLEGISILSNISSGVDITAYFNKYSELSKGSIRGGASGCCRSRKKTFGLGCTMKKDDNTHFSYYLKIDVSNEDRVYIDEENLYEVPVIGRRKLLFKTIKKERYKGDILVEYNNKKKGKNPIIQCDRSYSIISQLNKSIIDSTETILEVKKLIDSHKDEKFIEVNSLKKIKSDNYEKIYEDINFVKKQINNVQSISPIPEKIRTYVNRDNSKLFSDASNLSAVLDNMIRRYKMHSKFYNHKDNNSKDEKRYLESKEVYDDLLSVIKLLPEYDIEGLDIIMTPSPLRDVMFSCLEKHGDSFIKIPANLLSDGTLKVIAIATALVTYPENSVLLLDEFDSATHQAKAQILLQKLYEISKKRNITLIVTTHNTSLLNKYDKNFLVGTSIIFRNKETGNSNITNFYDLYDVERLIGKGGLGDAALKDGLKEYLYPRENKDVALPDWLLRGNV